MNSIKFYHSIKRDGQEIGKIQIIDYQVPHVEYDLDPAWHNKGIMTKELEEYLKRISNTYEDLMAIVEKDNKASIRVLEKNNFLKFNSTKHHVTYVWTKGKFKRQILKEMIAKSLDFIDLNNVK